MKISKIFFNKSIVPDTRASAMDFMKVFFSGPIMGRRDVVDKIYIYKLPFIISLIEVV
jgi:hypothetical protein